VKKTIKRLQSRTQTDQRTEKKKKTKELGKLIEGDGTTFPSNKQTEGKGSNDRMSGESPIRRLHQKKKATKNSANE